MKLAFDCSRLSLMSRRFTRHGVIWSSTLRSWDITAASVSQQEEFQTVHEQVQDSETSLLGAGWALRLQRGALSFLPLSEHAQHTSAWNFV